MLNSVKGVFSNILKDLWIWMAWDAAIKLWQRFWCSGKTFLPARKIFCPFCLAMSDSSALLFYLKQYFNACRTLILACWCWWDRWAEVLPSDRSEAWIMFERHVTLFVWIYAFSLPKYYSILTLRHLHPKECKPETASLLLEVSGSQHIWL